MSERIGASVVLTCAAGIMLIVAAHLLLGWLWILGGVIAGCAAACATLAVPSLRRHRLLVQRVTALAVAVAVAATVIAPVWASARPSSLAQVAALRIAPITRGDTVISPSTPRADAPAADAPVLVRRVDGHGDLLWRDRVIRVDAQRGDLLALTADGTRLVHASDGQIRLRSAADGWRDESAPIRGTPIALAGNALVVRSCSDGMCRLDGYQADGPEVAQLWSVTDGPADASAGNGQKLRGPDPAGVDLDAVGAPTSLDAAARRTGILPAVPLRFDPAQGWIQLDPATGFPVGEVMIDAADADRCRITAAPPAAAGDTGAGPSASTGPPPQVLTVCADADGSLTATAYAKGARLWTSDPSPAGEWSVLLDQGVVLATGTEHGTDVRGEIVASGRQAAWGPPGGELLAQAEPLRVRIGIDGDVMLGANTAGQAVLYGTAGGEDRGSAALSWRDAAVRGDLGPTSAVVLDPAPRTSALSPRGAWRVRVIDPATGRAGAVVSVDDPDVRACAVGRVSALLTTADGAYLVRAANGTR